jgi:hypothetical protein
MSDKFESIEFDGKKKTVRTGGEARKAFCDSIRKFRKPMSAEERYNVLMESFELTLRTRQRIARQMETALKSNDTALIKQVAQHWVDYELMGGPLSVAFSFPASAARG